MVALGLSRDTPLHGYSDKNNHLTVRAYGSGDKGTVFC